MSRGYPRPRLVILEMSKAATEAGLDAAIGGVGDEAGRGVTAGGEVLGEGLMVPSSGWLMPVGVHGASGRSSCWREKAESTEPSTSPLERDSSSGQSRQIGGRIAAVAMKTQVVSPHRVEYDEKKIRAL